MSKAQAEYTQSEDSSASKNSPQFPDFDDLKPYLKEDVSREEQTILELYYRSQVAQAQGDLKTSDKLFDTLMEKYGGTFNDMLILVPETFYRLDIVSMGYSNHKHNEQGEGNYWTQDITLLCEDQDSSSEYQEDPPAA
jgi:hypothetical protein